jgi:hypothetical protein
LIVRPCAWQLEAFLAKLQARPREGRPPSLGSESRIDMDLSSFVIELANKVGVSRSVVAAGALPNRAHDQRVEQHFDVIGNGWGSMAAV